MLKKGFFSTMLMFLSFFVLIGQTTQTVYSKSFDETITYVAAITTELNGDISVHTK